MYSVLIYGFPLVLLIFERGLRTILHVDSMCFTGPTLAAAGLSFLVPLTKPKQTAVAVEDYGKVTIMTGFETQFIVFVWLLVLGYLFCWSWSCYESLKCPNHQIFGMVSHLFIGICAYAGSLIMTFIKEKI